ncbi:MAG: zf-HC2 domain-containing protein [Pyrinomonadaceae bacterium]
MKCDECLNLLEAYVDGEAGGRDTEEVGAHLIKCEGCTREFETLTAEAEVYQRYARDLQISPAIWNGIAARIAVEDQPSGAKPNSNFREWFAGLFAMPSLRFAMPAVAVVAIAVLIGAAYWRTRPQPLKPDQIAKVDSVLPPAPTATVPKEPSQVPRLPEIQESKQPEQLIAAITKRAENKNRRADSQSDVLFTDDAASTDIDDRDTASHLEQAQNLLVSIRNIKYSDDDQEVDVSYEKAESRRLLNENVVLRRDAEMAGKFPAKSVLGSLEPFLIDIANLPDKATPNDVRQIKDRVQKTEIVAELRSY